LADKIDAAYAASLKLFASNQRSLTEMLGDDAGRQQLNDIYDSLNVVHRLHERRIWPRRWASNWASTPTTVTDEGECHAATSGSDFR
jgi:hypothetical protein